jgi:acyl-coenzyme A thioesterase PaaI-like protein
MTGDDAAAARAGAAGRRLLNALIASNAPSRTLHETADELDRLAAMLEPHATPSRYTGSAGPGVIRLRDPAIAVHHPLLGAANPIAPPLVAEQDDDGWVIVRGTYDKRAEGMPGLVHGGVLAMGFDLALGIASAAVVERPAMTGTLSFRYRAPTPLHREVVYRAVGERRSDRTVRTHGALHVDGRLRVEAEGIWVVPTDPALPRVDVGE